MLKVSFHNRACTHTATREEHPLAAPGESQQAAMKTQCSQIKKKCLQLS